MKKRILRTLLFGTLVLTLAGCGSKPEVTTPVEKPAQVETPAPDADNPGDSGDVAETPAPAQEAKEDAISDTFYQMITDQVYVLSVTQDGNYWANYSDEATYPLPLELCDIIQADLDAYFTENNLADQGVYELAFKDDGGSIYRVKFIPVDGKMPMFEGNVTTSDKAAEYNVHFGKRFVEEGIEYPTYSEIVKDLGSNGVLCELSGTDKVNGVRFAWYIEDTNELLTIGFDSKTEQASAGIIYKQREVGGKYFDR